MVQMMQQNKKVSFFDTLRIKSRRALVFHILFVIFLLLPLPFLQQVDHNLFLLVLLIAFLEAVQTVALIGLYLLEPYKERHDLFFKGVVWGGRIIALALVVSFFYFWFRSIRY